MVLSVTAPLWSDVSDRSSRVLGHLTGSWTSYQDVFEKVVLHENLALCVAPTPWWEQMWRGRVLMQDDFEGTLKWAQLNGTVSRANDVTFVHDGSYAMKLLTGAVAGNPASAEIHIQGSECVLTFATLECYWALSAVLSTTPKDFYFTWLVGDRSFNASYLFGIRFWYYDGGVAKRKLQYWNNAGVWADILPPVARAIRVTSAQFNHWMLMLRRSTVSSRWEYGWLFHNDEAISINHNQGQALAYSLPDNTVVMGCTTDVAAATTAYVDDFTLMDQVGWGDLISLDS